VTWFSKY